MRNILLFVLASSFERVYPLLEIVRRKGNTKNKCLLKMYRKFTKSTSCQKKQRKFFPTIFSFQILYIFIEILNLLNLESDERIYRRSCLDRKKSIKSFSTCLTLVGGEAPVPLDERGYGNNQMLIFFTNNTVGKNMYECIKILFQTVNQYGPLLKSSTP